MHSKWLVVVSVLVGCVSPADVPCGDRVCPGGTVCEMTTMRCLSPEQSTVCSDQAIDDGDVCKGTQFEGICTNHVCLPGCGDGAINDEDEECDDGNFRSHDGCSSNCRVETLQWTEMHDPWTGMLGHVAAYSWSNNFLLVLTGESQTGLRTQQWGGRYETPGFSLMEEPVMPSPRKGSTMAYFGPRGGGTGPLVLFGGSDATGFLDDTWTWTYATGWTKLSLTTKPSAREGAQMVYDTARSAIVLFGGYNASGYMNDTWEFNGTSWNLQSPSNPPSARVRHAMTYDEANSTVVMYGGSIYGIVTLSDHWQYNSNGTWTQVSANAVPGKRNGAVLAYAPNRGVVLFGGFTENSTGAVLANDTWQFNGSWTQQSLTISPPARASATLTLAPAPFGEPTDELILIGGEQSEGKPALADVWRLTTAGWVDISPHGIPPARQGAPAVYDDRTQAIHIFGGIATTTRRDVWSLVEIGWAMPDRATFYANAHSFHSAAYDPVRDRVVQFGGFNDAFTITNDTVETPADNTFAWTKMSPSQSPPARLDGVLAWDGTTLVLFGGTVNGAVADDTWTYNGTTWMPEPKSGDWPKASARAGAAYDPLHDRLVLFDSDGVTWSHKNHVWTKLATTGAPPARDNAGLAFDWQTGRMLLTGGRKVDVLFTDVWELSDTTWVQADVPGGGPLPRVQFGFTSTPRTHEALLIGGTATGGQPGGDVWSLNYRAQDATDEICDNGSDDDGDLHGDTSDPDCCAGNPDRRACLSNLMP